MKDIVDNAAPAALLQFLLWMVVGVAVLLLVVMLARNFSGYAADVREQVAEAAAPPVEPTARTVAEAEALAAAGRYEEAIHLLLLVALVRVARANPLPGSLTSREVLARPTLTEAVRPALGLLVRTVESTLFGSRPADETQYKACREAYEGMGGVLGRIRA